MGCKVFAFYRTARHVVVEPNERVPLRVWPGRLAKIFSAGDDVWQLHLDNPEDFERIRKSFFDQQYWEKRSWEKEYNQ